MREATARLVPPSGASLVSTERGSFSLWFPAPQVLVGVLTGHMTREMSDFLIPLVERRRGSIPMLYSFFDWLEMTGYESRCRSDLTAYALRNRDWTQLHLAVKHPLVRMGVTVANLALGEHLRLCSSRPELEQRIEGALTRRAL